MIKKLPLDQRVWPGVIILSLLMLLAFYIHLPFTMPLFSILCLAHLLFFRDVEPAPEGPEGLLAPADGKVIGIDEVHEDKFLNEPSWRIRIFLSVFDGHVTRSPMAGIVKYQHYTRGSFFNALRKIAFEKNESNWIGIENRERRVLVRQMTGAIARRIYSDVKIGQTVGRGEKLGMICYGSGVEFFIAKKKFRPAVHIGKRVLAGSTLLGAWSDEP